MARRRTRVESAEALRDWMVQARDMHQREVKEWQAEAQRDLLYSVRILPNYLTSMVAAQEYGSFLPKLEKALAEGRGETWRVGLRETVLEALVSEARSGPSANPMHNELDRAKLRVYARLAEVLGVVD